MTREDVRELHYICAIENLPSVLDKGILSHRRATKVPHRSVAMPEIQGRRKKVVVPGARPLHDYVNLYINARNKMMFKIVRTTGSDCICVLRIDPGVLELANVVIADQNASSDYVRFGPSPKGLENIAKDLVFAQYWSHPEDLIASMRHGSIICAEVLVPDRVEPSYIMGAYVAGQRGAEAVSATAPRLRATINTTLFFR